MRKWIVCCLIYLTYVLTSNSQEVTYTPLYEYGTHYQKSDVLSSSAVSVGDRQGLIIKCFQISLSSYFCIQTGRVLFHGLRWIKDKYDISISNKKFNNSAHQDDTDEMWNAILNIHNSQSEIRTMIEDIQQKGIVSNSNNDEVQNLQKKMSILEKEVMGLKAHIDSTIPSLERKLDVKIARLYDQVVKLITKTKSEFKSVVENNIRSTHELVNNFLRHLKSTVLRVNSTNNSTDYANIDT